MPIPKTDRHLFCQQGLEYLAVFGTRIDLITSIDADQLYGFYINQAPRLKPAQEAEFIKLFKRIFNMDTWLVTQIRNSNSTLDYRFLTIN